jgi:hypothetical protein
MKKFLSAGLLVALLFVVTSAVQASGESKKNYPYKPSLMSTKGYWVIHESTQNPKQVIVMYYNNKHELVEKEIRTKRNADTSRKKVLRSLKRTLEEALDWAEPISWDSVLGLEHTVTAR